MTYKTVLVKYNGARQTLQRGLTLKDAKRICSSRDASSMTCTDLERLRKWGKHEDMPWFVAFYEE